MPAENEGEAEGGQNRQPDDGVQGLGAVLQIASHLAKTAITQKGKLSATAAVQLALRDPLKRREILEQVIVEVSPDGVDEASWCNWLQGGRSPFEIPLRKVAAGSDGPTRLLARSTPRVRAQEKKVERARAALQAEERELVVARAYENGAVHWHVVDQLSSIVEPAFAMGPAWTIMRALSAHLSDAGAEAETFDLIGKEKERAIEAMRSQRVRETSMMMEVLDLGSGNEKFEAAVRSAVKKVCADWDKKREDLLAEGRKARSCEQAKIEVHPKASNGAEDILAGLRKAS